MDVDAAPAAAPPPSSVCCESTARRVYTRDELEALRFSGDQLHLWAQVYAGLGAGVAEELDGICAVTPSQPQEKKWPKKKRKDNKTAVSSGCQENDTWISEKSRGYSATDHHVFTMAQDYSNGIDTDSDDEYEGILKPAFLVEGDPDFESGPPVDGFEYIRRVRWEAAQIPNFKVAEIDRSKLSSEQTQYMPEIPDIPQCSSNLLPTKEWEDAFLSYFSQIRQFFAETGSFSDGLFDIGLNASSSVQDATVEQENSPDVPMIYGMDTVARASTLENYIDMLQSFTTLSRKDFLWLYAMCVAVDAPLHPETSASLRCLLRKCSGILSAKSEVDDEVARLNVLITICGRYFGQLGGATLSNSASLESSI